MEGNKKKQYKQPILLGFLQLVNAQSKTPIMKNAPEGVSLDWRDRHRFVGLVRNLKGSRGSKHSPGPTPLKATYDLPLASLFSQKEGLLAPVTMFLISLFNLQMELLDHSGFAAIDLNGSVPARVVDSIEVFEISIDSALDAADVFLLVVVGFGDAGEVEGEVFLSERLLPPAQGLTDLAFVGGAAGCMDKKEEQKRGEKTPHFGRLGSVPG